MNGKPLMLSAIGLMVFLLLASLGLVSCQPKAVEPLPPEIAYGRDQCDRCGMIISEERFAAGLQLDSGDHLKFDDTGEMIKYLSSYPETKVMAWWVHDYDSVEWIRGEAAFYVKSTSLMTPMGTGIAVFRTKDNADQFAREHDGVVYNLEQIRAQVQMTNINH